MQFSKTFIHLIAASFILSLSFTACSSKPDPSGTYTRTSDTEIRLLTDTIKISASNSYSENLYNITQSSATWYKNPKDSQFNKLTSPNTITGTLNSNNNKIETEDPGIVYTISNDAKSISINGITYTKTK